MFYKFRSFRSLLLLFVYLAALGSNPLLAEVKTSESKLLSVTESAVLSEFEVNHVDFYESGPTFIDEWNRDYKTEFPFSRTRYMMTRVFIGSKKDLGDAGSLTHNITVKYYDPDGKNFGSPTGNFRIEPGNINGYFLTGWGYSALRQWKVGRHRVDVIVQGKLIKQAWFTIIDDRGTKTEKTLSQNVVVQHVAFFEGPVPEPYNYKRKYVSKFKAKTTRHIHYMITARNLNYKKKDSEIFIDVTYLIPDTPWVEHSYFETIPSTDKWIRTTGSYGNNKAGNLSPGEYWVMFFLDGKFTIQKPFWLE